MTTTAMETAKTYFDYNGLPDKQTRALLKDRTTKIHAAEKSAAKSLMDVGRWLQDAKEAVPHGQFMQWVDAEFGYSYPLAVTLMRAAKFAAENNVEGPRSVLIMLSAPSVPDEVKAQGVAAIQTGELKTVADAKALIRGQNGTHTNGAAPAAQTPIDEPEDTDSTDTPDTDETPVETAHSANNGVSGKGAARSITQAIGRSTKEPAKPKGSPHGEPIGEVSPHTGETMLYSDHPDLKDEDPFEDEPAPQVTEDDLEDEDWIQSLPLSQQLVGDALNVFRGDALGWRTLKQSVLGSLKNRVDSAVKFSASLSHTRGPLLDLFHTASRAKHPREWELCPSCRGSREFWMNKKTKQHLEPGTVVADEGNLLNERATRVTCDKCKGGYILP